MSIRLSCVAIGVRVARADRPLAIAVAAAVAEGVETREQAAELYRLGYRLAQGYYFGRPSDQLAVPVVAAV